MHGNRTLPVAQAAPAAHDGPLLPLELLWLYPFLPLAISFLVIDGITSIPVADAARKIAAAYIPTLGIGFGFHLIYAKLMPRLLRNAHGRGARGLIHAVAVAIGAVGIAQLILPVHNAVCRSNVSSTLFTVQCVLISTAIVVPALLVQSWRLRVRAAEQQTLAQRRAVVEAQLETLQARTNPHFFFNSLNTIASFIHDDPNLAERTLERLAALFRYALAASNTRSVPLQTEFDMVRDYLAIQQARFGDRLVTSVELAANAAALAVPPLLLQPLVENAILHGLHERAAGSVHVSAERIGERVVIRVRDDGPGPTNSKHAGTQTSVADLRKRVHLAFGDAASVTLTDSATGGCVAEVSLPCAH